MSVVDVEYEKYPCPHCKGKIIIRTQYYILDGGESYSLQHVDEEGSEIELEEE